MSADKTPTLSVVMATYNGARFVREQLDSLSRQTRLPDELVVCDDGSTDATVDIVTDFARQAPFPVQVKRNAERLGYADNFLHGAATWCQGEIIAFCDQDDVWHEQKLERCAAALCSAPDRLLAVHAAEFVDADLRPLRTRYARGPMRLFTARRRGRPRVVDPLRLDPFWVPSGYTMVFRARLGRDVDWRQRPLSHMVDGPMPHDQWIYFLAIVLGRIVLLPERLALYRQHGANLFGADARATRERVEHAARTGATTYEYSASRAAGYAEFLRALAQDTALSLGTVDLNRLEEGAKWYARLGTRIRSRARLYQPGSSSLSRLRQMARMVGRGDYGSRDQGGLGLLSFAKDAAFAAFKT